MEEENYIAEKMTNALVSFLDFLKKFKEIVKDDIISDEKERNNKVSISYTLRKFNIECYIIDKKYFDEFCSAINFFKVSEILKVINEESKNKCKEMLEKLLKEKRYNPDFKNLFFYADEENMKKILKRFNNYSFLNKEILIDCMGVPEENLKNKMILLSKNESNTSLLNVNENFIVTINVIRKNEGNEESKLEVKKEEENKKNIKNPKNIYYVEEITKKIFILLFKKDELLKGKIEKKVNDPYNFKTYYLINKQWLTNYKNEFLYDNIIRKINQETKDYSYKRIKTELNEIIKNKIGQIKLYGNSEIPDNLKDFSEIIPKLRLIKINDKNKEFEEEYETKTGEEDIDILYNIPYEFEIINEDIYELIKKEEFFENYSEENENKICYQILLGNEQIIIKNKLSQKFEEKDNYSNELLFFTQENDEYDLKYILSFEKKVNFYEEIKIIINDGLKKYLNYKKIKLIEKNSDENILDENENVLGKIININIDEDFLNKVNNKKENNISKIQYDENIINIDNEEENINNINDIEINNINISQNNSKNEINYYQDKDEIINEIQDNNIIEDENNIINEVPKEDKDSIKNILKRLIKINDILENITKNIIINTKKDQDDLKMDDLTPKEIESKLQGSSIYKIILMTEDDYENYKKKLNFDKIKKIINNFNKRKEKQDKKNYLLKKKKELINFFEYFDSNNKLKIPDDIKLINDYSVCEENIKNKKKFFLLSSTDIKIEKDDLIFYFKYKSNPYIYFKEGKKIFKVKYKNEEDNLYNLEIYKEPNSKIEYLKILEECMEENKTENLETSKAINIYYLINNKWIGSIQDNSGGYKKNETFMPKYDNNGFSKYPINFNIVLKDKKTESIIENILEINEEDIAINKGFVITEERKSVKKKYVYIGIIDDSSIYFYLLENKEYIPCFLIMYNNKANIEKEINEKILSIGIWPYINFMVLNNNNNKQSKLYNIDFIEIGSLQVLNKNFNGILKDRKFPYIENINVNYKNIKALLICLSNINEIKNYIPLKLNLIKKDSFLFYFFQILRMMWSHKTKFVEKIKVEQENIFLNFLIEIRQLSGINEEINIFNNLKILVETIILNLQKDYCKIKYNEEFIYQNNIYKNNKGLNQKNNEKIFMQDIFFFDIGLIQECKNCKRKIEDNYTTYYLEFDVKENMEDMLSIFKNLDLKLKCECGKDISITRRFISLPKYLIIIINNNINKKIKNFGNINIKEFCKNIRKAKYELYGFVDKNSKTICKSPTDSKFYEYGTEIIEEGDKFNEENNNPNLLIYKIIK